MKFFAFTLVLGFSRHLRIGFSAPTQADALEFILSTLPDKDKAKVRLVFDEAGALVPLPLGVAA